MTVSTPGKPLLILRLFLLCAWASAIAWLSLTAHPPQYDIRIISWDKLQHAAAYALLALLAGRVMVLVPRSRHPWLGTFMLCTLFGGLLEIAQVTLTANRVAEYGDLLADAVGAGVICVLTPKWLRG